MKLIRNLFKLTLKYNIAYVTLCSLMFMLPSFASHEQDLEDVPLTNLQNDHFEKNKNVKKILILDSYHQGHQRSDLYTAKLLEIFNSAPIPIETYIIRLDSERIIKADYWKKRLNIFLSQYPKGYFNLFIVLDDNALNTLYHSDTSLLDNAPLIFLGACNYNPNLYTNSTGIIDKIFVTENLDLIFNIFPKTQNIAVISENNSRCHNRLKSIKHIINEYTNISATYFNTDIITTNELLKKIEQLPTNTVIFLDTISGNKDSKYISTKKSYQEIINSSPYPVFTSSKLAIESGALGGVIQDTDMINKQVSSMAMSLLTKDNNAKKLTISDISTQSTIFNWNSILKLDGAYENLPEKTAFINRPKNSFGRPVQGNHILNVLYKNAPPLIYNDKAGTSKGPLVELWKIWSEKTNIPIQFIDIENLSSAELKNIYHKNIYTIYAGRSKILADTHGTTINPIFISNASIYYRSDHPTFYNWNSLRSKKIAIVANESFQKFLLNIIPNATIIPYNTAHELIHDINNDVFDAFFMEDIIATSILREESINHQIISSKLCSSKISLTPETDPKFQSSIIINKLSEMVNIGFETVSFETTNSIFSASTTDTIRSFPIFTLKELEWISNKNTLTTNNMKSWLGMENWIEGIATGLIPDLLQSIIAESSLKLKFIETDTNINKPTLLITQKVDFLDFSSDSTQKNLLYSIPYLELPAATLSLNKQNFLGDNKSIIAIPNTYTTYYYYFKKKYPGNTIILTNSSQDCADMVKDGTVDIAILNEITASHFIQMAKYKSLFTNILFDVKFSFAICVLDTPDNRTLINILNKAILTIPTETVNTLIAKNTLQPKAQISFYELLNLIEPWLIAAIIILLALWGFTTRRALNFLNISKAALQKEKSWLSATMHSIGEGVIATDKTGRIVQMNIVAEDLTQWKEQSAIGEMTTNIYSLYDSLSLRFEDDPIQTVLKTGKPVSLQQNIILKNKIKLEIPITATATPIKEPDKQTLIGVVLIFKDIRAEAIYKRQLSQTKTLLSNAINLAGLTYFTYDITSNKILISSGKNESYLYMSSNDFDLKEIFLNVLDEDLQKIEESWTKLLSDQIHNFSINYRTCDNDQILYKRADILSEKNSKDEVVKIFGVRLDVTESIIAENEKQISRERIEQAYNLAKLAYWEYSPASATFTADHKINDMFMLDTDASKKLTLETILTNVIDEDKTRFLKFSTNSVLTQTKNYEQEMRIKHHDQQKTLKLFANNSYDTNNKWISCSGAVLDITELNYVQEELKASEEQKRLILSSIKESVAYLNNKLEIIWANEATGDMFNCDIHKIIGQPCYKVFHNRDTLCINCKTQKMSGDSPATYVESLNFESKELLVSTNIIRNSDGEITHLVKTFSDISELKEIQNNLKEAYERAETANKAKSTFLSTMTHEIRTPLNAIIGFSGLLQYENLDANSNSYANSINTAAKGLLYLINNVLDFSRIEANKLTLNLTSVQLSDLIQEMNSLFGNKAKSKGLNFSLKLENNIPPLILDKDRLRQVLINLIGNALKFTHEGSINLTASLKKMPATNNSYNLFITITDTGIGIPEDSQSRIFDSFEQQESNINRKYEGSGLGLSISKRLIELMNGEITLSSIPETGSTFTIILNDVKISKKAPYLPEQTKSSFNSYSSGNVLVVSKIQHDLTVTSSILAKMGLRYETMSSIHDAIEITKDSKFDVIITSMVQPNSNGETLIDKLHNNKITTNIPVIALTGYSDPTEHFDTKYYSSIIIKPISVEGFSSEISKYLTQKEKTTTHQEYNSYNDISTKDLNPKIIAAVLTKFKDKFSSLRHGIIISEAKEISENFIDYATELGDENLIIIAQRLDQYISTFKLPDMMNIIKLFLEHEDKE